MKTKIKYLLVLVFASFVFAGCATHQCCKMSNGNSQQQWEYKAVLLSSQGSDAELNKFAKDGWMLVSVVAGQTSAPNGGDLSVQTCIYYFKRPLH